MLHRSPILKEMGDLSAGSKGEFACGRWSDADSSFRRHCWAIAVLSELAGSLVSCSNGA